ncbi:MAG: hypothetical protein ACERKK_00040 [Poseidonibacter sp.]|uniref:hypothetical protein n=1 Tax=Poseidonibacter sp. TaxID=2321188 RepID=UPI00359E2AE1
MFRNYIIYLVIFIFAGCSQNYDNNFFKNNVIYDKNKIQYTFDSCTNSSYILNTKDEKYGKLFIEYISLDIDCRWNGLERGYFEYLFKQTLKIKEFKVIERLDYENYEISTLLIDNKYYLNIIHFFIVTENTFIIDQEGVLTNELINKFDKNYKNEYLNKNRYKFDYNKSLVNLNFINAYFSKEIEYPDSK